MFKEVTFSYNILSDPDKRRQYDTAGFEVSYTLVALGGFRESCSSTFKTVKVPSCMTELDFIDKALNLIDDVLSLNRLLKLITKNWS
ncbi:hypothetical protein Goari_021519 [Gossypium aridum]|uniref:J domain-containing protein n=1 Tax=Gossypium aridum TaxID=34290 RepID=A0A7J8YEM5_GOSAI|nr:hypothetical protein [Gossypium aridum]